MSTLEQIDHAVEVLGTEDLILLHACSTYPAYYEELNLRAIPMMRERYGVPVGYSGHETGIASTVAAAVLGACCVERHITLDRSMWGSDHAASLEPNGISRVVRDIRLVEQSMGDGVKRVYEREQPIIKKLRRVDVVDAMKDLKAIVLDVDGVLTDGGVWWGPNGEEWKRFSFADIMGVSLAMKAGLIVGVDLGRGQPAGRSVRAQDGHHRHREELQGQGARAARLRRASRAGAQRDLLHGRRRERPGGDGDRRIGRGAGECRAGGR